MAFNGREETTGWNGDHPRVLLVDDEKDFLISLADRLALRGIRPNLAFDGWEALRRIEEEIPEIIILDLRMPGLGGLEVLRRVRRTHPEVQVVILTGHGTQQEAEECLSLGAVEFLQKPASFEKIMDCLRHTHKKNRKQSGTKPGGT
ncbi:MAG: response regulator [Thermodesulfobacteriota bacterium]